MRIPIFVAAIAGGFCIVTSLIGLGSGAPDWWVWLVAGLLAEAVAVSLVLRLQRAPANVQSAVTQARDAGGQDAR